MPLMNRRLVQRLIWERASQLTITYRGGPLAPRGVARPRPGDRVPDLECRVDGRPTRLYAELGRGWALLAADPAQRTACADIAAGQLGAVARLEPLAGRDEASLIRPDGHLAWRGRRRAALGEWLAGVLSPPRRERAAAR
ncbi:aromatic-ring hydroxylase C-terminal domain-containing protein [Pseudonocardia nigra]|uniref:aromatic-ring hydroxylase C-terminal domain-containing protein n=1 Tax=Pseudonocardia nigra TaxID=1921578 RepID=UPI001C5FC562|nr:hypothetical protein [Pseudonocardia nigra]